MAKVVKHYCTNCKNNHSGSRKSYLSIFQDLYLWSELQCTARLVSINGRHFSLDPSRCGTWRQDCRVIQRTHFAPIKKRSPRELFDGLSENIIENASSFEPQGISNVLWDICNIRSSIMSSTLLRHLREHMKSTAKLLDMLKLRHFLQTRVLGDWQ